MSKEAKSKGHVAFVRTSSHGDFEFYVLDGEVYRAPITNAMDVARGVRFGRWEGPERHLAMLLQQQVDVAKKFGGKVEIDPKYKKLIKEDTMTRLNGLLAGLRQDEACARGRKTPRGRGVQDGKGPHGSGVGRGRMAEDLDDVIHEVANPQYFADASSSAKAVKPVLGAMLKWQFSNPARGLNGSFYPRAYRVPGAASHSQASGSFEAATKADGEKFYKMLQSWAASHGMEPSSWASNFQKPNDFISGEAFYVKGAPKHNPLVIWKASDPYGESELVVGFIFHGAE